MYLDLPQHALSPGVRVGDAADLRRLLAAALGSALAGAVLHGSRDIS